MIVLRFTNERTMTSAQLQSLFNGHNITRWSSIAKALNYGASIAYPTRMVFLGCDGRFWIASTPRLASRLLKAGYEVAL